MDDKEYVGSTKQKLAQRFSEHKSRARGNKKNMDIYNHMRELGLKKFYIVLLEEKKVSSRIEQLALETVWQEKLTCELNQLIAQCSIERKREKDLEYRARPEVKAKMKLADQRYRENSREKKNANAAKYRENNREKINAAQQAKRAE